MVERFNCGGQHQVEEKYFCQIGVRCLRQFAVLFFFKLGLLYGRLYKEFLDRNT